MTSCEIILDRNIALHFPRLDQLDWPALSGHRECAVVIAPILLRELEQKKIFGAMPSIKERAGKTIDYLVGRVSDDEPIEAARRDVAVHGKRTGHRLRSHPL